MTKPTQERASQENRNPLARACLGKDSNPPTRSSGRACKAGGCSCAAFRKPPNDLEAAPETGVYKGLVTNHGTRMDCVIYTHIYIYIYIYTFVLVCFFEVDLYLHPRISIRTMTIIKSESQRAICLLATKTMEHISL